MTTILILSFQGTRTRPNGVSIAVTTRSAVTGVSCHLTLVNTVALMLRIPVSLRLICPGHSGPRYRSPNLTSIRHSISDEGACESLVQPWHFFRQSGKYFRRPAAARHAETANERVSPIESVSPGTGEGKSVACSACLVPSGTRPNLYFHQIG